MFARSDRHRSTPDIDPQRIRAHFDAVMARRGAAVSFDRFEPASVVSDGHRLHLDVIGGQPGRPTLVFCPGTSVYGLIYGDFLARVADTGLNVVSFDPRGHGQSEGIRGSYTVDELVRDGRAAVRYARGRFGDPIVVAGSSQGGIVAFYLAATDEPIAGAICHNLADLAGSDRVRMTDHPHLARLLRPLVQGCARLVPELGLDLRLYLNLLSDGHDDIKQRLIEDPLSVKRVTLKTLASLSSAALQRPVDQIRTPIQVLHGARDDLFPQDYVEAIYQRLTCPKDLVIYPDRGHFLFTEDSGAALPAVVRWIDTVCADPVAMSS